MSKRSKFFKVNQPYLLKGATYNQDNRPSLKVNLPMNNQFNLNMWYGQISNCHYKEPKDITTIFTAFRPKHCIIIISILIIKILKYFDIFNNNGRWLWISQKKK